MALIWVQRKSAVLYLLACCWPATLRNSAKSLSRTVAILQSSHSCLQFIQLIFILYFYQIFNNHVLFSLRCIKILVENQPFGGCVVQACRTCCCKMQHMIIFGSRSIQSNVCKQMIMYIAEVKSFIMEVCREKLQLGCQVGLWCRHECIVSGLKVGRTCICWKVTFQVNLKK